MLGFHDTTRAIDERNEARMNFRTKPRIKNAIQQAAALSGVDDSVFTMNAAYQAALATIAAHDRTVLQPVDHEAFFAALDAPAAPTEALRAAYDAYSFKVIPAVGQLVAKDRDSYQYLVESIRRFPDQRAFAAMIGAAGFRNVSFTNFTGGVAALHQGWAI